MADRARWDRLVVDLTLAGIAASVDERPYPGGTSRSITLRHPRGGIVHIGDSWWRKNPDVWTGWQVTREGADSIVRGWSRGMKKRSETVAAVRDALDGD